ncbi:helix-turn-helix domain-containing protein [Bacillus marasmi]|uniref:helix-turn-helix domain-containing protein n=1 Tax=Bacillus marasmi TaxID=1926279 RepID=UPI0011CB3451|nr:XRE family transcriptional regulator [Bacillus marasmi]
MPNSIGERIKNRRKELKMSQTELAKMVGLQPPAISQYESGARRPSYEALRKLAFALTTTTEYLMNGEQIVGEENTLLMSDRVFLKILHSLPVSEQEKLVEYAAFLASGRKIKLNELFENPADYANHLLTEKSSHSIPVDVFIIAKELGVKVVEEELAEAEGLLIQGDYPIIVLDSKVPHLERRKFTLAALIGHYLIPWHLKPNYLKRKYIHSDNIKIKTKKSDIQLGASTILIEDFEEIEANQFASNLLVPHRELKNDITNQAVNFETLKNLAQKYEVSLFFLLNRIVEIDNKKFAVVQSENNEVKKVFQGERQIKKGVVDSSSIAATFFSNPSTIEEIRIGHVPASCWVQDAEKHETVYEQSIFNPEKLSSVLTLLTFDD